MENDQNKDKENLKTSRKRRLSEPDDKQAESSEEEKFGKGSKIKRVESPNIVTTTSQNLNESDSFRIARQTEKISFVLTETFRADCTKPNTVPTESSDNLELIKDSNAGREREQHSSTTVTVDHATNIADTVEKDYTQIDNLIYEFEKIPARESYTFEKINVAQGPNDSDQDKELKVDPSTWPVLLVRDSAENLQHPHNYSFCNDCLKQLKFEKVDAKFICFSCETYLCSTCINFHLHHRHSFTEDSSTAQEANHDIHIERTINILLDDLADENDGLEKLEHETKSLCERIDIKHSKDIKDCWIRNIAILKSGTVAVTDSENNSIKLLDIKHNIHRRIELSSWPCGIAELLNETENSATSSTEQSVADSLNDEQQANGLLAITCPYKEIIMIIDITKSPAVIVKCINVHRQCFNMIIYKGEFLVVCIAAPSLICFIKESGEISKIIELYHGNLALRDWYPRIEIHPETETLYVSSYDDNKILAMNLEGKVLKAFTHENLLPYGIVVNEDETVYLCSESNNAVYKLSRHFETLEPLIADKDCALSLPAALARHKGKLYISSDSPHHPNIITVISIV